MTACWRCNIILLSASSWSVGLRHIQHAVLLVVALISWVDRYLKTSLFWLIDRNCCQSFPRGIGIFVETHVPWIPPPACRFVRVWFQTVLMVAITYFIYSCGTWHFLAFHEWQQVHRCILPQNLSMCWSHHVNYSSHIQYDHRCLFGSWIITISWHRWQAPKYLWFCARFKFTFVWQCWGFPCIFINEELGHVWVWSSLKSN